MNLHQFRFVQEAVRRNLNLTETAKALWGIYVLLTLLCFVAYWIAGMSWFDALIHTGSTVSIGGLSSHDASLGHFNSATIEVVAIVFMLLSGINFAMHFSAFRRMTMEPPGRFMDRPWGTPSCRSGSVSMMAARTARPISSKTGYFSSIPEWPAPLSQGIYTGLKFQTAPSSCATSSLPGPRS